MRKERLAEFCIQTMGLGSKIFIDKVATVRCITFGQVKRDLAILSLQVGNDRGQRMGLTVPPLGDFAVAIGAHKQDTLWTKLTAQMDEQADR